MTISSNTAARGPVFQIDRRDRISAASVIAVTLLALLLGALLRSSVQGRTSAFSAPGGVAINYPRGWTLDSAQAKNGSVTVRDMTARGAPTEMQVQTVPVEANAQTNTALADTANNLALTRGQQFASFKAFGTEVGQTIRGLPGAKSTYVYVTSPNNVFREHLPSVMLGEDRLVKKGDKVYVFSLQSTEANRDAALKQFERFVNSAKLP